MYKSISMNDVDFAGKLINEFKSDGFVVINDVFTDMECDTYMDEIIDDFVKLNSGIDKNNINDTWVDANLPPQTRPGLFQALMANLKSVWTIRAHNNVKVIFEILYSHLRNRQVNDFIVSGDGINIKPNMGPYTTNRSKDWAHLDQTTKNDIYKCIQGQAVLTTTTASFVASPKSHLVFDKIMDKLKINDTKMTNWLKFDPEQLPIVKELVGGENWQKPIVSRKGSFIVWASTVIHSARLQNAYMEPIPTDKYLGWRGVVYVCYRPKEEFNKQEIATRLSAFNDNRVTNHWSLKIFDKKQGQSYYTPKKCKAIEEMVNEPKKVYDKLGKPILSAEQNKLLGINIK